MVELLFRSSCNNIFFFLREFRKIKPNFVQNQKISARDPKISALHCSLAASDSDSVCSSVTLRLTLRIFRDSKMGMNRAKSNLSHIELVYMMKILRGAFGAEYYIRMIYENKSKTVQKESDLTLSLTLNIFCFWLWLWLLRPSGDSDSES